MKKKLIKKLTRKCTAFYRWFRMYHRRVKMTERELGGKFEAC